MVGRGGRGGSCAPAPAPASGSGCGEGAAAGDNGPAAAGGIGPAADDAAAAANGAARRRPTRDAVRATRRYPVLANRSWIQRALSGTDTSSGPGTEPGLWAWDYGIARSRVLQRAAAAAAAAAAVHSAAPLATTFCGTPPCSQT